MVDSVIFFLNFFLVIHIYIEIFINLLIFVLFCFFEGRSGSLRYIYIYYS